MATQRDMPMVGELKPPAMVPAELLKQCRNRLDAIRLCVQLSSLTNETICERLGIDPGHFTRIMRGQAHFPDTKSVTLMRLCGNYAPLQYEAMACGFELVERSKDARIRELEEKLAALKGVA